MPAVGPLKVFVSSTSEDLGAFRAVAQHEILAMGWQPVMAEHFGARPVPTVKACREAVEASDVVVFLYAFRRGHVPTVAQGGDDKKSITALEIDFAREKGLPILAFLADPKTWPGMLYENEQDARRWVEEFRRSIDRPAAFFELESDQRLSGFRATLKTELAKHKEWQIQRLTAEPSAGDHFPIAREGLRRARSVPFVGSGVFADGPLSASSLTSALEPNGNGTERSLATVAEFQEHVSGSRPDFLDRFADIVANRSDQASCPSTFDLLARLADPSPPPLIVSATYDLLLESRMKEYRPAIVTHVLRSKMQRHDGRILVLREGQPPTISPADQVDLTRDRCVIYKPLGSPLLNQSFPDLEEIDTTVVTETDHALLLSRLESVHTGIPTALSPRLRQSLLFLGYHLDVWQYRLVVQVFKSMRRTATERSILAVRQPESPIEVASWRRLGASLIPMSLDGFASRV